MNMKKQVSMKNNIN